jgi:hypothetical protein
MAIRHLAMFTCPTAYLALVIDLVAGKVFTYLSRQKRRWEHKCASPNKQRWANYSVH